jgi:protein-arginine kinase activator protein McsA
MESNQFCENCAMSGIESLATELIYTNNAFGNTDSRDVHLCHECAEQWSAYNNEHELKD